MAGQKDISEMQTQIMKEQKIISEGQVKLTQQIDEGTKAMRIWAEYYELGDFRKTFWNYLEKLYSGFRETEDPEISEIPNDLDKLIDNLFFRVK